MVLSSLLHVVLLAVCVFLFRGPLSTQIVAAGEGQGSGGGAIEVGLISSSQLGFTKPRAVSQVGEETNEANNTLVETRRPQPEKEAEVLPSSKNKPAKPNEKVATTERPTANQTEQLYSKQPLRGRSANTNVEVGRTFGSPTPAVSGGIGIGAGGSAGYGTGGVPGGSEYGRRIQMILGRNYNPPAIAEASGTHYVIIQLRIARNGRILSLAGGRVAASYIKQSSPYGLVNRAAERAIIASDPLPPFPSGFLSSAEEAVAEIWFRYPK
jgi:outer membrane biosynthesis protein TonB